jgi:hypothetical protein
LLFHHVKVKDSLEIRGELTYTNVPVLMNYTALLPTSSNEITRHNPLLLINANNKIKIDCALTKISNKNPNG